MIAVEHAVESNADDVEIVNKVTNKSDKAIKRPEVEKVPPDEKLIKKHEVSYLTKNIKKYVTHALAESEAGELNEESEVLSNYNCFEATQEYQEAAKYTSSPIPCTFVIETVCEEVLEMMYESFPPHKFKAGP